MVRMPPWSTSLRCSALSEERAEVLPPSAIDVAKVAVNGISVYPMGTGQRLCPSMEK
jgi:hypothetical protein